MTKGLTEFVLGKRFNNIYIEILIFKYSQVETNSHVKIYMSEMQFSPSGKNSERIFRSWKNGFLG